MKTAYGCGGQVDRKTHLILIICLCAISIASAAPFHCLESISPFGRLLRSEVLPGQEHLSSGQLARRCVQQCAVDSSCSIAWAVSGATVSGPLCQLYQHNVTDVFGIQHHPHQGHQMPLALSSGSLSNPASVSWLCFKRTADWRSYGEAVHNMVMKQLVLPVGLQSWCSYSTDVAGTTIQVYSNITEPQECQPMCINTPGCTMWLYGSSQKANGSGHPRHSCTLKKDVLTGDHGWTAGSTPEQYDPRTFVVCLMQLQDWDNLGMVFSPGVEVLKSGNHYYTLFPERVKFSEASKTCSQLKGGSLAVLPNKDLLNTIGQRLLRTVAKNKSLQSAWVAITGLNARAAMLEYSNKHSATRVCNCTGSVLPINSYQQDTSQEMMMRMAQLTERSLHWLESNSSSGSREMLHTAGPSVSSSVAVMEQGNSSSGIPVDGKLLKHMTSLKMLWSVSQQLLVPDHEPIVCGRVVMQVPPTGLAGAPNAAASPGIYYFDCNQPASFICQSTVRPEEPQIGRYLPDSILSVASGTRSSAWQLVLAITLPLVALAALLVAIVCLYSQHVDRVAEILAIQRKRTQGKPHNGPVSVVVTDIQSYTQLMHTLPDEMAKALLLHNRIMRKCSYAHAGYILEQEGDAFTIAFHTPSDAVAFTLQAQQALLTADFSSSICYNDDWERWFAAGKTVGSHLTSTALAKVHSETAADGGQQPAQGDNCFTPSMLLNNTTICSSTSKQQAKTQPHPSLFKLALQRFMCGGRIATDCQVSAPPAPLLPTTSSAPEGSRGRSKGSAPPKPAPADFLRGVGTNSLHASTRMSCCSYRWQQGLKPSLNDQHSPLFKGLRVRMGVATGDVCKGQSIKETATYARAKLISDIANGGQVLLDENTFGCMKEQLQRLGAVTADGMDYQLLRSHTASQPQQLLCGKFSRCFPARNAVDSGGAVVLDMGLYSMGFRSTIAGVAATAAPSALSQPDVRQLSSKDSALDYQHSSITAAACRRHDSCLPGETCCKPPCMSSKTQSVPAASLASRELLTNIRELPGCHDMLQHDDMLRLYQVLPPSLAGRAAVFGSTLSLKAEWHCLDQPYFAAPGLHSLEQRNIADADDVASSSVRHQSQLVSRLMRPALLDPQKTPSYGRPHQAHADRAFMTDGLAYDNVKVSESHQVYLGAASGLAGGAMHQQHCHPDTYSEETSLTNSQRLLTGLRAASLNCCSAYYYEPETSTQHASSGALPAVPCLPTGNVTAVFVAVEGSDQLLQQCSSEDIRHLHSLLHQMMLNTLLATSGSSGYLVRAQDDLRYIAMFCNPCSAVEWCLTVQEAALYLQYLDVLLQQNDCLAEQFDVLGRLVFRGPRLRMGICEGVPKCITPDCNGRADYHGSFVNLAARYCDAAAHGGQVVMDNLLAEKVLQQMQPSTSLHSAAAGSHNTGSAAVYGIVAGDKDKIIIANTASCDCNVITPARQDGRAATQTIDVQQQPWATSRDSSFSRAITPMEVEAQSLGTFLFKGCTGPVSMVHFAVSCHGGRKFLVEAPRGGKGIQVARHHEVVGCGMALLPTFVAGCRLWPVTSA